MNAPNRTFIADVSLKSGSASMCANARVPIRTKPKLANRFYEPIILLACLNNALIDNQPSKTPDLSLDVVQTSEHAFRCFVNKLGQLCDTERGGNTVTAFVVLQYPDRIQYRFSSNQRENEGLNAAKIFVITVLQTLGRTDENELEGMLSHVLRQSLSFTRPRVEYYVKQLKKHANPCMTACGREDNNDSKSILEKLEELRKLLSFADETELDDNTFSKHCEELIEFIDRLYQSKIDELIRAKTKEGRINESKCWCELRHAMGRLLSYLQAIKFLISTRKRWPELFESFEVCYISSSIPAQSPLRHRNRLDKISTKDIIGRMTSKPEVLRSYIAHAQELQKFGLDENIRIYAEKFHPIVHAEVLLLESLENDGGTQPSRFFNCYKYIGCSKPTCRLCDYYFSFHKSGVEVRSTHRNLYPKWRMPDVYKDQGPQVEKERENLMNKILGQIREDTFRTLSEKVPDRKQHDSNTEPTYPVDSILIQESKDIENLAMNLKDLSLQSPEYEAMDNYSNRVSFEGSDVFAIESDNEEDGGVKI